MPGSIDPSTTEPFQLGDWRVEPAANELVRDSRVRQLEPRVMQLLLVLAAQPGQVLGKDELIEGLWGATVVTDNALAQAVAALRKGLDDNWQDPRYLQTISKRGYRLLVRPEPIAGPTDALTPALPQRELFAIVASTALIVLLAAMWTGSFEADSDPVRRSAPLTSLPGRELQPAISPDGKRTAFSWAGESGDNWDLYVQTVGGAGLRRVTSDAARDMGPSWSPDGLQLAWIRRGDQTCEVLQRHLAAGTTRRLADCRDASSTDWSPDGAAIAFDDSWASGRSRIRLVDVVSAAVRDATAPPDGQYGDLHPRFSPEGNELAFRRIRAEHLQDVFIVDLDSGEETRLTNDNQRLLGLDWDPDGQALVVASHRANRWELWRVGRDGSPPTVVPVLDGEVAEPTVGPDGILVYATVEADSDLWHVQPGRSAGPGTALAASSRHDGDPALSRGGDALAFVSDRSGAAELWRVGLDGSGLRQLTNFGHGRVASPEWSPDDAWLVFDARVNGQADVYRVPTAGGAVERLTRSAADDMTPAWSPDGGVVVFASNRENGWQLWSAPAAGGPARRLTVNGGYSGRLTRAGELLFTHPEYPGLWRRDAQSGEVSRLIDDVRPLDWGGWGLLDHGIYYISASSGALTVQVKGGGERQPLLQTEVGFATDTRSVAVTADGTQIVYSRRGRVEGDLRILRERRE